MPGLLQQFVNRAPIPFTHRNTSSLLSFGSGSRADHGRQLQQMEKVSTLFSIVDLVATKVSSVDWHLYRTQLDRDGDRVEVTDHPALVVWDNPATVDGEVLYTQDELIEASQQHYELTGEVNIVLEERSVGRMSAITDLWPVRADRIAPVKDRDKFLAGYIYTLGEDKIPLRTNQVIVEKRQNPTNPWRGLSPVAALMTDIEGEKAAAAYNYNFFVNGALPNGILELGNDALMSDREWQSMVDRWRTQHQGVSNAHRIAVMEMGSFKDNKITQKDMEFTSLRHFSRESMMEAYRTSPAMLGHVEDVNRSTAEAQMVIFAEEIIVPRLERWKKLLNRKLLPKFGALGQGVEFDYDNPVPKNAGDLRLQERADVLNTIALVGAGANWEQTLDAFDLPPIAREYIPASMAEAGDPNDEPVNVEPGTVGDDTPGPGENE